MPRRAIKLVTVLGCAFATACTASGYDYSELTVFHGMRLDQSITEPFDVDLVWVAPGLDTAYVYNRAEFVGDEGASNRTEVLSAMLSAMGADDPTRMIDGRLGLNYLALAALADGGWEVFQVDQLNDSENSYSGDYSEIYRMRRAR